MKNILFTGRYNGIIGGIERYIQKSAALLRRNGFAVHYLYTEDRGQDQQSFAGSFDTIQKFTPENDWLKKADLVIVHNIIPPELLKNMPEKIFADFFATISSAQKALQNFIGIQWLYADT